MILTGTGDLVRVTTSGAADIDVQASWADQTTTAFTPGRTNTKITSATTTTVVGSPAASTQRSVHSLKIRNIHASASNTVTVLHTDAVTSVNVFVYTLLAGEGIEYDGKEFHVVDATGAIKGVGPTGAAGATGSQGATGPPVFLAGESGEDGEQGRPGIDGVAGVTGAQGPIGPPVFLAGESGEDGEPGKPGADGATGATGTTGAQGPIGPPVFLAGESGEDGEPGKPGVDGAAGAAGATGSQGPIGPPVFLSAESGEDGEPGAPGRVGTDGAAGATGAQGPIGPPVFLSAESGEDGEHGSPGAQGPTGATGAAGGETLITGATGAVAAGAAPSRTLHVLTADGGDITGTGLVVKMTAQTLNAGWWLAEYFIHWESDVTSTGIGFRLTFSGTQTKFMAHRIDPNSSATALATIGVSQTVADEGVIGNLPSIWSTNANDVTLGPNAGVVTVDSPEFTYISALFLVTIAGDLQLQGMAEVAATIVRIQAGTNARYTRLS